MEASKALLDWFGKSARRMEWRETDDPYRIWVSEVMLQQTRVETVKPYYRRFLEAFPDVKTLAEAPLGRVLKLWEGLGYYSRARNLHLAANRLVSEKGGRLPDTAEELLLLPGIGRTTAGAIAAIAFRKDAPILDANVRRVLSRLHGIRAGERNPGAESRLWELSRRMIPPGKGRETALALMDLGAMVCTSGTPKCGECPLSDRCAARIRGPLDPLPRKGGTKSTPVHDVVSAILVRRDGKFLIVRRPGRGLLGGLWGLPGGRRRPGEPLRDALSRETAGEFGIGIVILRAYDPIPHAYSHFRIRLHGFLCRIGKGRVRSGGTRRWIAGKDLPEYAFGRADRKLMDIAMKGEPI